MSTARTESSLADGCRPRTAAVIVNVSLRGGYLWLPVLGHRCDLLVDKFTLYNLPAVLIAIREGTSGP